MLKKFFLNILSAFVGAWAAIILLIVAGVLFFAGMISSISFSTTEKLVSHSILRINLEGNIDERESLPDFNYSTIIRGQFEQSQSLRTIIGAIEKAAVHDNIEAIYLNCNGVSASPATLNVIREALLKFKQSGKKIFAYGNSLSMSDYFVATAADNIYLNPAGSLNLQGINGTSIYFKEFLDKIGVDVEIFKVGTYKSAVEPFSSNQMSEPAKAQLDTLYGAMWNYITEAISKQRKVSVSNINSLVDSCLFLKDAKVALNNNLVDGCIYQREFNVKLAEYVGEKVEKLNFVSPGFIAPEIYEPAASKNQIAIVYAVGDIAETEDAGINCNYLVPVIVRLADDENVKGMVLRVNSPGGSVFGSEQIGEALDYFKSKGKPLAVSMGDYAASGGYWISAGADRIFADPLTITGSIGIFGMVPNVERLTQMIGVHPQTVGTNPNLIFPSIFYPMTEFQKAQMQNYIEEGYEKFIKRVATGRKKSETYIKSIAQGRVWNAMEAKKLGLVDALGGLNDAVSWVSDKASLEHYNAVVYPQLEETLMHKLQIGLQSNSEVKTILKHLQTKSIEERFVYMVEWLLMQEHAQARAPFYEIKL